MSYFCENHLGCEELYYRVMNMTYDELHALIADDSTPSGLRAILARIAQEF